MEQAIARIHKDFPNEESLKAAVQQQKEVLRRKELQCTRFQDKMNRNDIPKNEKNLETFYLMQDIVFNEGTRCGYLIKALDVRYYGGT